MKRLAKAFTVVAVMITLLGSAVTVMAAHGGPGSRGGGEVVAINGDTITVENPRGQLEIVTTAETTFMVNGEVGSLADVQVGMFAGAKGERSDDGTTVTATMIFASDEAPERPDGHRPGRRGVGGEVVAINGDVLTVENPRGEMTIVTTAETTFMVNGEAGSLADIQVGIFAGGKGELNEDGTTVTATTVFASDEAPKRPNRGGRGE